MLLPAIPTDTGFTLYYITITVHVKLSTDFGFESNSSLTSQIWNRMYPLTGDTPAKF
jgi:hypothetical protein